MITLTQPPNISVTDPMAGIKNYTNTLNTSTNTPLVNTQPLTRVSGIIYKKSSIESSTYNLNSTQTQTNVGKVSVPTIPSPSLTPPTIPTINPNVQNSNVPNITNIPTVTRTTLQQPKIPSVPTLSSITPPPLNSKIKTWLSEPMSTPTISKIPADNVSNAKPPFF